MFMLILLTVEIKLPALYPFIILHIILDLRKNREREGGRERERKTTGCPPFLEIEWNGKFSDKTNNK